MGMENKRVTRASRKVLGEITSRNIPRTSVVGTKRKSNVVGNLRLGQKKALRQTKVGTKGALNGPNRDEQKQIPMEVEQSDVESRRIPEGVADIDEEDAANPQLCAEYAQEIYAFLKQLEKQRLVRSDFLSGCPITDKM